MAGKDNQLGMLHELLIKQYMKELKAGCSDPRILKEVRELLKDNDITGDISDTLKSFKDEASVEMPDDWDIVSNG